MKYFRLKDSLTAPDQEYSKLAKLMKQLDAQEATVKVVKFLLPEDEAQHCTSARIQGSTVFVAFDSNAWATRFRFRSPEILKQMKTLSQFSQIEKIVVSTNRRVSTRDRE